MIDATKIKIEQKEKGEVIADDQVNTYHSFTIYFHDQDYRNSCYFCLCKFHVKLFMLPNFIPYSHNTFAHVH